MNNHRVHKQVDIAGKMDVRANTKFYADFLGSRQSPFIELSDYRFCICLVLQIFMIYLARK